MQILWAVVTSNLLYRWPQYHDRRWRKHLGLHKRRKVGEYEARLTFHREKEWFLEITYQYTTLVFDNDLKAQDTYEEELPTSRRKP